MAKDWVQASPDGDGGPSLDPRKDAAFYKAALLGNVPRGIQIFNPTSMCA